jgi:hypothetical protein
MSGVFKKSAIPQNDPKTDITGEQIVMEYLKKKGYSVDNEEANIEVKGEKTNFLVQVKSSIMPKAPVALSPVEEERIKIKAVSKGFEAWEAKVLLNKKLEPVGDILWRKLC